MFELKDIPVNKGALYLLIGPRYEQLVVMVSLRVGMSENKRIISIATKNSGTSKHVGAIAI